MRLSILVFVILAVFASVVFAAKKQEQQYSSDENVEETSIKETLKEKAPVKKPLKKEPNAKKPSTNKKPVPQKNKEDEEFEEEAIFDEEIPESIKKPSLTPANKNKNKKKPIADSSVPQPPKRGQKPPKPIKEKPDEADDNDLPFDLPKPPSPPVAYQ